MKHLLLILLGATALLAADSPPYQHGTGWIPLLNGRDAGGWHGREGRPQEWFAAAVVQWNPSNPEKLTAQPQSGPVLVNGPEGRTADLITDATFGDVELY